MDEGLLELADRAWTGQISADQARPMTYMGKLAEVAEGIAFVPSFGNVTAFRTEQGLVLVDSGGQMSSRNIFDQIRSWSDAPVHTVIYTHGHIDHVFGVGAFDEEADQKRWPRPRVVAHAGVPRRFERYVLTAGYNTVINRRQFGALRLNWPTEYRFPDEVYRKELMLEIGGVAFELHHAKGETDDHTWTWVPSRKALCCGDFFIWASPNAGNPQKVQRYPKDWAEALRTMAAIGAEILLPGHGLPVVGAGRVKQALEESAELLESLHEQTLELMNRGARLDEVIHGVQPPSHLIERPYLRPTYDEPEFIVRNIWRLYGGWYDGNPANLKPAPEEALAQEIALLAGGAARLADRAVELAEGGELRLAGHFAELAAQAAPRDRKIHETRARVNEIRAEAEASTMSKGIFGWAARESRKIADGS